MAAGFDSELRKKAVVALVCEQICNEFVEGRLPGEKNIFHRGFAPRLRARARLRTAGSDNTQHLQRPGWND